MRLGTMFKDVATALVHRPVTEKYPFVRYPAPERLRGRLTWQPEGCTGCGLCVTDCPAQALELIMLDKKAKRFVLTYHVDRCTFCAQCVTSCRHGCLAMSPTDWELAAVDKAAFEIFFGAESDVDLVLAGRLSSDGEPPETA